MKFGKSMNRSKEEKLKESDHEQLEKKKWKGGG